FSLNAESSYDDKETINVQESDGVQTSESSENSSDTLMENEEEVKEEKTTMFAPMLSFDLFQESPEAFILTPGIAFQFAKTKPEDSDSKEPDAIVLGASYSQNIFTCGIADTSSYNIFNLSIMGSLVLKRHQLMFMGSTSGETIFKDLSTSMGLLGYTYQFIKTDHVNFQLGLGVAAMGAGVEIGEITLYAIPLPMLNLSYNSKIFNGALSYMGSPSLDVVLFPKSMFRLKGSCTVGGFSSISDIGFDCSVACYPFVKTAGDFLSVSAGVCTNGSSYVYGDKNKLTYISYCAYGEINASALIIRAGWNFTGEKIINKEKNPYNGGLFLKVQAMYAF
ncbi:MAG: hypothetical protein K6A89_07275, partial [Treponema sp.]|nr:hypothetical protein [Treponema sp.]